MKIRMDRRSLRLRLRRSEVDQITRSGKVEEGLRFGPGSKNIFSYSLEMSGEDSIGAALLDKRIEVHIPKEQLQNWALSDDVGIEGRIAFADGNELNLLIEKDFVCLTGRPNEDQADNFPHPDGDQKC